MKRLSNHIYGMDHPLVGKFVLLGSGEPAIVYGAYQVNSEWLLVVLTRWNGGSVSGLSGVHPAEVLVMDDCERQRLMAHVLLCAISDQLSGKGAA